MHKLSICDGAIITNCPALLRNSYAACTTPTNRTPDSAGADAIVVAVHHLQQASHAISKHKITPRPWSGTQRRNTP